MAAPRLALEMRNINKAFAGNVVLQDVSITAQTGSVLALLGENGAGKSTLMKILAGVHQPDAGEIFIEGQSVKFANPIDSLHAGVAMIYQELSLAPHLTVAENIFLGREPTNQFGFINQAELNAKAKAILQEYGFQLDPRAPVSTLSTAKRQLVEITRAIVEAKKIIVMDEPTSSLTAHEVEELFRLIHDLKTRGLAVIYISHRLEELDEIADQVTILRDGKTVFAGAWGTLNTDEVIRHMAGRELKEIFPPRVANIGAVKLAVKNLSRAPKFFDINFVAHAGEVVGIAGLAGAGRTELVEAIFGTQPATTGEIFIDDAPLNVAAPHHAIARGLSLLTEDRKRTGLCLNLPLTTNLTLANVPALLKNGVLQNTNEHAAAQKYIEKLHIRPPSPSKIVGRMSGGNQQKVLLGRWLFANTQVFLLDEPTRGVDVAARAEIYREINELAETGAAIVMVSSDLPELLGMADRIYVMRRGKFVTELKAKTTSQEEILMHAAVS